MSTRWTADDLAEYQSRRMKTKPLGRDVAGAPKRTQQLEQSESTDEVLARMISGAKPTKDYKAELVQQLALVNIAVESEFKIFETRKFRADWRVTDTNILIEYEGGIFHKGKQGHDSVKGLLRDIEKGNLCALGGWMVIRVTPKHVTSGEALRWIETAVETVRAISV